MDSVARIARSHKSLGEARGARSLAEIITNWANESAFIFRITRPRWAFTVISSDAELRGHPFVEMACYHERHDVPAPGG